MADGATARARPANRRAISVTCALHKCPKGFDKLVVEKQSEEIVVAVHVAGKCVIILEENAATTLFEALRTWLGR
ncbi:MAG: hypothetical protein ACRDRQ_14470 [Pseudonocardiaceae bacterium]